MAIDGVQTQTNYQDYGVKKTGKIEEENQDGGNKFSLAKGGDTYTTFEKSNANLANSVSNNGGSYRSSISQGKAQASDCKDVGNNCVAQNAQTQSNTSAAQARAKANQSAIQEQTSLINGESQKIYTSQSNIKTMTAKQEQVAAWLENAQPTIEAMTAEIDNITAEALGACADFGEFETIPEAMEAINEMMGPIMEEIAAKQAEREAKSEEQANLDPSDPDYDSKFEALQGEIDGLDGEIGALQEDEGYVAASDAMAVLMDASEAIGELSEAITNYQADVDAKSGELEQLESGLSTESAKTTQSANNVQNHNSTITDIKAEDEENKSDWQNFLEGAEKVGEVTTQVGTITNTTGTVTRTVGELLCSNPYTAAVGANMQAVGGVMESVGGWTSTAGGAITTTADVGLGIETGESEYFLKAAKSAASTALSAASAIKSTKAAGELCKNAGAINAAKAQGLDVVLTDTGKIVDVTKDGASVADTFKAGQEAIANNTASMSDNLKKTMAANVGKDTTGMNGKALETATNGKGMTVIKESNAWDKAAGAVEKLGNNASTILEAGVKIYDTVNDKGGDDDSKKGDSSTTTTTHNNTNKNVAGSGSFKKGKKA